MANNERCLLDTHVLVWAVADPRRLNDETRRIVAENRYAVSVATLWELMDRRDRGDAPVRDVTAWWDEYVVKARTPVVPIRPAHLLYLDRTPMQHRDPYDRVLLAQSSVERMPLITADTRLLTMGETVKPAVD